MSQGQERARGWKKGTKQNKIKKKTKKGRLVKTSSGQSFSSVDCMDTCL